MAWDRSSSSPLAAAPMTILARQDHRLRALNVLYTLARLEFQDGALNLRENGSKASTSPPPIYVLYRRIVPILRYFVPRHSRCLLTFGIRRTVLRSLKNRQWSRRVSFTFSSFFLNIFF
ncbi:hypothetical protein GQ457_18G000360 [Hibiscus cannabinus]